MDKLSEKLLSSRRLFDGRLLGVRVDTVELPGGVTATREVVEHPGAVAIVALTADHKLVLVRQFRTAAGEVVLEIPAGVPGKKEKGEEAARRELAEETGYHAKTVKKVWQGFASPGYSNEVLQFFLAGDLELKQQSPDEDEFVEVELIDLDKCFALIKSGGIKDSKTFIGVMIADLHRQGKL
jgi:ADP-ribose pyrophosphatase